MPTIGWVFLLLAIALVVGSLLMLKDSANMPISKEKMARIKKRKAEVEAQEKKEKEDDNW
ncbi:DUF2897 family protein [Marinobacter bryozoorum]|jgi:hypothetical protein|uniref:DUF2897 family protein n=1 Tax=Marinobacter bryozoorum TaxID=256324 RepID=UPI0020054FFD|nr:DUF2897 family protein [Marinobacter bryozoorum]MCK7544741.1 DUF2897 family protein [Marinobacter bryozoorum]